MKTPEEKALSKAYHRPEVKDYGNISKLTAGALTMGSDSGRGGGRT
jgi:hypothetical protein